MIDTIIKTQKFFLPPGFGADLDGWAAQSLALATQGAIKVILKKRGLPNTESILDDTTRLREELPFSIQHLISQHHPILGEGGFGQVLWLQTDSPPTAVALKTFTKRLHKFKWRDFVNEVMIHRALSNEPHVIRCHGATIIMGNKPNPLILMEPLIPPPLAPASYGSLETIGIQIKQKIPPEFAILALRYFQRQAISAVESVHARGFLHLDIKPNNFVVGFQNERWLLKITDFGFSENRDALHSTPGEYQARGSACMVSPEICDDQLPDYPADIFSLGATLYFTETNQTPFKMGKISAKPNSKRVLSHRSIETIAHLKPLLPSDISTWIIQALDEAPSRRPTASEMHKWWATLSPPEDYPSHAFDTYFSSQKSPNS
jgi:serine/threonine protein kinase